MDCGPTRAEAPDFEGQLATERTAITRAWVETERPFFRLKEYCYIERPR